MPLWSDDFNRADGPVGGDWVVKSGAFTIASNKLMATSTGVIVTGQATAPGASMAQAVVSITTSSTGIAMPAIRINSTGTRGWGVSAYHNGSNTVIRRVAFQDGVQYPAESYTLVGQTPSTATLRIAWSAGTVYCYINGTQVLSAVDSGYSGQTGLGVYLNSTVQTVDDFSCSGDGTPQLLISPRVVGTEDGDQLISVLGVGVTWTPGTPGTPSFSVNAGSVVSQQVTSTTNATVVFSPPATPQVVTFSDVADGLSSTITVVDGTYLGGGTGGVGGLSEAVISWLETQAPHAGIVAKQENGVVTAGATLDIKTVLGGVTLQTEATVGPDPENSPALGLLPVLWRLVNGGYDPAIGPFPEPPVTPLAQLLGTLAAEFAAFRDPSTFTIQDIMDGLRGTGDYTHADLYAAIGGISGGSNQDVLDYLDTIRGDEVTTLANIYAALAAIRTVNTYHLGDVKTWIESARGTDLPTIRDVLTKLGPSSVNIDTKINALSDLIVTETTIQGMLDILLAAISGRTGVSIADVYDLVDDLPNQLPTPITKGHPLVAPTDSWTLGTPVALAEAVQIDVGMDGILVDVVDRPSGVKEYPVGDYAMIFRAGYCAFINPMGYVEEPQYLSFTKGIYIPKTCTRAAGVLVKPNQGQTGTVTPYTVDVS